ncbi:MAG: hypothetical protein AB7U98_13520 [Candidatus Nitrosocosmicus sp.]
MPDRVPKILQVVLGIVLAIGFFGNLTMLFFVPIPEGNKDIIIQLLVMSGTFLGVAVTFAYGSSIGSQLKDGRPVVQLPPRP